MTTFKKVKEITKMNKHPNENKKPNTKKLNTEENAIYSDPKDASNMQPIPQPKDYDEIEY